MRAAIEVVLPAHNEGGGIRQTLEEFYKVVSERDRFPVHFIVCEDGSKDNTVEIIKEVAERLPVTLISEPIRKGYSRAVIDGFKASSCPLVSFIDSDGQCDPGDFKGIYQEMVRSDCDLVVGYRNPRQDPWIRLLMSAAFNQVYKFYFNVKLRDPSCPYLIIKREALMRVLDGNVGILKEGFWWEFFARAQAKNLRIRQVPVTHRKRTSGATVVYRPAKVPGIAWAHLRGLAQLSRELKMEEAVSPRGCIESPP